MNRLFLPNIKTVKHYYDRADTEKKYMFYHLNKLVLAVSTSLLLVGCLDTKVKGSGNVKTEIREVRDFSKVVNNTSIDLHISQTGDESLTIEAEDNILPLLTSDVSNGTLSLGAKPDANFSLTKPAVYKLSVKNLKAFRLNGSANTTAANIRTPQLEVVITGSGNTTFSGIADHQDVSVSGSGKYDAFELESKQSKVILSGSGDVFIHAKDELDVTISGSGNVQYKGTPKISQSISGSGSVKPK